MTTGLQLTTQIEQRLLARNQVMESFFAREAPRLAEACREMSERFLRGGRLLARDSAPALLAEWDAESLADVYVKAMAS